MCGVYVCVRVVCVFVVLYARAHFLFEVIILGCGITYGQRIGMIIS